MISKSVPEKQRRENGSETVTEDSLVRVFLDEDMNPSVEQAQHLSAQNRKTAF